MRYGDLPDPSRRYWGKFKAFVRDNADPENRGRLRAFCPQVMGEDDVEPRWLGWAEPCFPWMGGVNTLDFGPPLTKTQNGGVEVGVWVEFEDGQVDHPIWVGTWVPAPTPTSPNARQSLLSAAGVVGGDILENPPSGSALGDIAPPKPNPTDNEARILVKEGREIVIGSVNGGYITVGPYGVSIVGVQVLTNGRLLHASLGDKVVG